jgi:hypothetical protein
MLKTGELMRTVNVGDRFLLPAKHTWRRILPDPKVDVTFVVVVVFDKECVLAGNIPGRSSSFQITEPVEVLNSVIAGDDTWIWKLLSTGVMYKNKERVLWRR